MHRLLLEKKLLYQSCHRGCKETDIMLGEFAKKYIHTFSDGELIEYAKLVDLDDVLLFAWITGQESIPPQFNTQVMQLLMVFNNYG